MSARTIVFEQMGQRLLNDCQAIDWLHSRLMAWGKTLEPANKPSLAPKEWLIANHFRAELYVLLDYEKADRSLCIQVRLKPRRPGRHRERFIYLRLGQARRRLDQARAWRVLGRLPKGRQGRRHRRLTSVELSRDIYWTSEMPPDDLKAQLIIALVQLRTLPQDSNVVSWLYKYTQGQRFRIPIIFSHEPDREESVSIRQITVSRLLSLWSGPEDFRAFRKYIRKTISHVTREELQRFRPLPKLGESQDWEEQNRGSDFAHEEDAESNPVEPSKELYKEELQDSWHKSKHTSHPHQRAPEESFTVPDAAFALKVSSGYIYRQIRCGTLRAAEVRGVARIPRDEFGRLRDMLDRRRRLRAEKINLEESGKSAEAARKAVYRKFGAVPPINQR